MTQTCWFCKENSEDPTKATKIPLYKITDMEKEYLWRGSIKQLPYAIKTAYRYLTAKVVVPRCNKCARDQAEERAVEYVAGILGLTGIVALIVLVFVA